MSVTQTVDIPESRRLVIDVPSEVLPGRTILTFTAAPAEKPEENPKRGFGCAKGQFWMADDFDDPLEDFKDYM